MEHTSLDYLAIRKIRRKEFYESGRLGLRKSFYLFVQKTMFIFHFKYTGACSVKLFTVVIDSLL